METTTPYQVAEWLKSFPQVTSATPLSVQVGKSIYPACDYTESLETPEGSDAWRRGERTYTRRMVYCVGALPACYVRSTRIAFTCATENYRGSDWYVAAYYPAMRGRRQPAADPASQFAPYHPFGQSFMLAPWTAADPIDAYEDTPRPRVPFIVRPWSS